MNRTSSASPLLPPLYRSEAFAEDLSEQTGTAEAQAGMRPRAWPADVLLCVVPLGSALIGALAAATSWGA